MRVLVYWDEADEIQLIGQFLTSAAHHVGAVLTQEELLSRAADPSGWDVVLIAIGHPDFDDSFEQFCHLRVALPDVPVVGGSRPGEVYRAARFLTEGLRWHLVRDAEGDFVFLLSHILESAFESAAAEKSSLLTSRLSMELEGHRDLQSQLLPANLPKLKDYLLNAQYEAAQIPIGDQRQSLPGGDFYHVIQTTAQTLTIILGDAGGHGLKSTLSTMSLHASLARIATGQIESPSSIVSRTNLWLCQHAQLHDEGGMISLLCGTLYLDSGEFHWCSAGHPIPLIHDLDRDMIEPIAELDESCLPIGIVQESEYETHQFLIERGRRLILYSDGLEEVYPSGDYDQSPFGTDGIIEELRKARAETGQRALRRLFSRTMALGGLDYRTSDATAICIDRLYSESG